MSIEGIKGRRPWTGRSFSLALTLQLVSLLVLSSAFARSNAPWVGSFTAKHVVAGVTPDNSFSVLTDVIKSATESLHISVYELDNLYLGQEIEKALDRGVAVTLLMEGAPIPKLPQSELYNAKMFAKKGAKVYFYNRAKDNDRNERTFKYFHNKYTIADGKRVLVGSANYGKNGHPVETSFGNREWEIVLDDRAGAELFEEAFQHDLGLSGEWAEYGSSDRYKVDSSYEPEQKTRKGKYEPHLDPLDAYDVPVKTVFAPENSLDARTVLGTLNDAEESVDVEQLNFETYWGDKPYNPERETSPLMDAVLMLARAGKAVRIVLNNDWVFHEPDPKGFALGSMDLMSYFTAVPEALLLALDEDPNEDAKPKRNNATTMEYLNKIAKKEGLHLGVRLLNYKGCGLNVLHNKGMIVDNNITLVSSLNWGESAMKFNREAGVLVKSSSVAHYYARAFEYDWRCSYSSRDQ